jgi:prophage antirepressor-like protein
MSHTLIDIINNIIKYNNEEITVIIDNNNIPWFSAINVANVLGYNNTRKAIIKNVAKQDRTSFSDLEKFINKIPKNMQPHAIYINESGLYSLILNSKKQIAKEFRQWITSEVIPSIRKSGSYQIEEKYKDKLDKLNDKLKEAKKEIRILKHNQKKKNYKATGMIYVIRPIDTTKKNLLKPGKTTNFNERLGVYNTGLPNNVEILFTLEVDDPDAVEHCMKGLLHKYVYRKNKEYYECTLKKIREVIFKCDKLVHDEYYCENCQSRITSINHFNEEHQIEDDEKLYLDIITNIDQEGGINDIEELFCVSVKNSLIFEKYCQVHLYPFIDQNNKTYYECPIEKIKLLLTNCKENDQIDDQINNLINNHGLKKSDIILIDAPSIEQLGGTKYIPTDEFNEQIIVMDGGGFILPNGAIVYPNGKVVCPDDKIKTDNQIGGSDWLKNNVYNSETYKWLNDL